jgi:hypothetical protein
MLYGRALEMAEIDRLLAAARADRSGAVTVVGDVGVGKTAILDYAATSAAGMRVLRITGVESESELPFAALHLLLRHALDRIDSLPEPQAAALRSALGMADAAPADPFLVGLAALTLLADLAGSQPLLCVVDDAHWLDRDSAMALVFAARRLDAEGVVLIFAARDGGRYFVSAGLPEVRLDALDQNAASQLLAECAADLAPQVRDRLVADSAGNPLALIELSAALSAEQRAGHAAQHLGILPVSRKVQDTFLAQVGSLPGRSRLVLLVAAADTTEDRDVVLHAARTLGASTDDLAPAESSRLIQFRAGKVKFRHPLIRSVVYESASESGRIAVHRALADALDREDQSDRRAWHLAATTTGPDEGIAALMEGAAKGARRRGGFAAEAAAMERAAQLSPDDRDRGRRLARAAFAAGVSSQLPQARATAERAAVLADDPLILARLAELRAYIEFALGSLGSSERTARILLEAATAASVRDTDKAAELLFDASLLATYGSDPEPAMLAARQLTEMAVPHHLEAFVRAATGLAHLIADELSPGVEAVRESLPLLADPGLRMSPASSMGVANVSTLAGDDQAAYERTACPDSRHRRRWADLPPPGGRSGRRWKLARDGLGGLGARSS